MEWGGASIIVRGRAELSNGMKLDDITLTTDGVIREIYVDSKVIQTVGYIYVTKSKVGEISNVKFMLSPTTTMHVNGLASSEKPFIHSEGGSGTTPVMLKSVTFTVLSGSAGLLPYSIIEISDGAAWIVGCTFSDMRMSSAVENAGVMVAKDASVSVRNSVFSNISVGSGSANSECEWGSHSVVVLHNAVALIKDTMMSNTYAGISVHGGTAVVEGVNFNVVGWEGSLKYPSVERHLRCGMFFFIFLNRIYCKLPFFFFFKWCIDDDAVVNVSPSDVADTSSWISKAEDCTLSGGSSSPYFVPRISGVSIEYDKMLSSSFGMLWIIASWSHFSYFNTVFFV
jgi:hypothetical protein